MIQLMSTAWMPNIQYFSKLVRGDKVVIDVFENYQKQTYRNRCEVMTAGGVLALSVPIVRKSGVKTHTKDIRIDYTLPWQRGAWRTLVSAYRNSPYFDHYEPYFEPLFTQKCDFLVDWNDISLQTCAKALGVKIDYRYSDGYVELAEDMCDWRAGISPKPSQQLFDVDFSAKPYYQVFSENFSFAENLSILDLLFCEGRGAVQFLK